VRFTLLLLVAPLWLLACSSETEQATTTTTTSSSDGGGDSTCPAGTRTLADGTCQRAGVPPSSCAPGFEHDGEAACVPVLPPEPCAAGLMAVPGESSCRPVAECATGDYGDIPVDGTTQYVDIAYAGGDSDGTLAKPWTTISEAVSAATPGALVAVAAGVYHEAVAISGVPVRLWGRCPELVEVRSTAASLASITVTATDGAQIVGLSATNTTAEGIALRDSRDVVIDRVRIYDTLSPAVSAIGGSATVRRSLIENGVGGVSTTDADIAVEASVIRNMTNGVLAIGVTADPRPTGRITGSVVEGAGISLWRVSGTIEGTVMRNADEGGIVLIGDRPEPVAVSGCYLEHNWWVSLVSFGAPLELRATVIRETHSVPEGAGRALEVQHTDLGHAAALIEDSLIEISNEAGISLFGVPATLDGVLIRQTAANGFALFGDGVTAVGDPTPASLTVRHSVIANSERAGLSSFGSEITLERTQIECNLIDLNGETSDGTPEGTPFLLHDLGGNRCGCGDEEHGCQIASSQLEPPEPLDPP
jgi:hypothetical protein